MSEVMHCIHDFTITPRVLPRHLDIILHFSYCYAILLCFVQIAHWMISWLIYRVVIVSPGDSVLTATQKMVEVHASSAVVAVGNKAQGILTYVTDHNLACLLCFGHPQSSL